MKIISIDTSSTLASVSVMNDDKIMSFEDSNTITHSEKLLKLIDKALNYENITINDLDYLITTNGPGSFTGARIGVVTVKGLSMPKNIPIIAISSLEAIALHEFLKTNKNEAVICTIMNARNSRAYFAIYSFTKDNNEKISISTVYDISNETLDDISNCISKYNDVLIVSDMYDILSSDTNFSKFNMLKENTLPNSSYLIEYYNNVNETNISSKITDSYMLDINYARMSQAERMKNSNGN